MENLTQTKASIFLTDYASYNNGTQFEFGHWVNLEDFNDNEDFNQYVLNHFLECDKISPLDSPREETMLTDFEGFPKSLYCESGSDLKNVYEYLNLEEHEKRAVAFILEQGENFEWAIEHVENVHMMGNNDEEIYYAFNEWNEGIEELASKNDYITIDYDRWVKENFTEFEFEGEYFLVEDSWNQ